MENRRTRRDFIGGLALAGMGVGLGAGLILPEPVGAVPLTDVRAVVSTQGGLNLRAAANWSARVIKTLPNGTAVAVRSTVGDWYKVVALGRTGYVHSQFVTLTGTPSTVIERGNPNRKQVALTFDCGADRGNIVKILALLNAHKIKGSFGLTGTWVTANPKDALAIAQAGHQPINHTLDHPSFTGASTGTAPITPAFRLSRIVGNEAVLAAAGVPMAKPYWRPPYGDIDKGVLRDVGAAGYDKTVMWTVDTLGWNAATVDQIHARTMNAAKPGMIVLMHVGAESQDAFALDRVISDLKAAGYGFGTVADVIKP